MISTTSIAMQYGSKPLFEDISVTFSKGNRYGLIGANGSGKSTFMKILTGEVDPTSGTVKIDINERVAKLNQDHYAYEKIIISDCVIMGHRALWKVKEERDKIYSLPNMSEKEGMRVADLESEFAEMDGYMAESHAGDLLLGVGIPLEQHDKPMSSLAPGMKLRVLLAQALFGDPGILLLDEPTNNLD
ncbi:MAG: ATP-binding cassette domain-containing protein, partial [Candidatus Marinimicrobia bacterium]|nr:ATP-binding cassette domain-containing protein [Candidatus Neomarinimicrobiota bacterium]